ncbi:hypothetical protein V1477_003997 [Vespula maculifrons]|uniref:Maturase K n=1 Tax=Vespula maculifrons TaxID=7453 RepID=A0ABD2CQB4_VESMC
MLRNQLPAAIFRLDSKHQSYLSILMESGRRAHYRKFINFPILVQTVEFETTLLEVIKLLTNLKIRFKLEQLLL